MNYGGLRLRQSFLFRLNCPKIPQFLGLSIHHCYTNLLHKGGCGLEGIGLCQA